MTGSVETKDQLLLGQDYVTHLEFLAFSRAFPKKARRLKYLSTFMKNKSRSRDTPSSTGSSYLFNSVLLYYCSKAKPMLTASLFNKQSCTLENIVREGDLLLCKVWHPCFLVLDPGFPESNQSSCFVS